MKKTTIDTFTGKRFRYNEVVLYQGFSVPGRTTARTSTHLSPGRIAPTLWAKLNPGIAQPQPAEKTMADIKCSTDLELAIRTVIDYNWSDELCDFEENVQEEDGTHIFRTLVALDNWVRGSDDTPESYLSAPEKRK